MNQYEVTFIVDPVLSDAEIKATADNYVDHLKNEGSAIVHVDEMGLKQLAYPIKKRNSGIYYCIEFQNETGDIINKLELALRRDERIMRFLTIGLDKFAVKYNEDKRNGLIKKKERKEKDTKKTGRGATATKPASSAPVKPVREKVAEAKAEPKTEVKATATATVAKGASEEE